MNSRTDCETKEFYNALKETFGLRNRILSKLYQLSFFEHTPMFSVVDPTIEEDIIDKV